MYHDDPFPKEISYGARGGPGFDTYILELDSGREERVARRATVKHRYDVSKGLRTMEDLALVKAHYLARRGPLNSFPFHDDFDHHSNPENGSYLSSPGERDQLIGEGDGSTTTFQLKKTYESGLTPYVRNIVKPKESEGVRVWVASIELTEGPDYTVNYQTGVVTLAVAPSFGEDVEASFHFWVPCRYGKELDVVLSISLDDFSSGSIDSIPLVEDLEPDPGYADESFPGGSKEVITGVPMQIDTTARVWYIQATSSDIPIMMPDPTNMATGKDWFLIVNGGSLSYNLVDHESNLLAAIPAGEMVEAHLRLDGSLDKVWMVG